jgi:hypothetical protein
MARLDPDALVDQQSELIFIARNVREARRVEALLTDAGIDYEVAFEPFLHGGIFGVVTLTGLGFYVLSGQASFCRKLLEEHGLAVGLVEPPP